MAKSKPFVPVEQITRTVLILRGHRVLLDADLAVLYGVSTARLNQQVRRNWQRFPADFLFELTQRVPRFDVAICNIKTLNSSLVSWKRLANSLVNSCMVRSLQS